MNFKIHLKNFEFNQLEQIVKPISSSSANNYHNESIPLSNPYNVKKIQSLIKIFKNPKFVFKRYTLDILTIDVVFHKNNEKKREELFFEDVIRPKIKKLIENSRTKNFYEYRFDIIMKNIKHAIKTAQVINKNHIKISLSDDDYTEKIPLEGRPDDDMIIWTKSSSPFKLFKSCFYGINNRALDNWTTNLTSIKLLNVNKLYDAEIDSVNYNLLMDTFFKSLGKRLVTLDIFSKTMIDQAFIVHDDDDKNQINELTNQNDYLNSNPKSISIYNFIKFISSNEPKKEFISIVPIEKDEEE